LSGEHFSLDCKSEGTIRVLLLKLMALGNCVFRMADRTKILDSMTQA